MEKPNFNSEAHFINKVRVSKTCAYTGKTNENILGGQDNNMHCAHKCTQKTLLVSSEPQGKRTQFSMTELISYSSGIMGWLLDYSYMDGVE